MAQERNALELSTIRLNRGISLEQIAELTKIGVRLLSAIEKGEFHKLPGGIYDISYIRQYADAIDYDESIILDAYRTKKGMDIAAAPVQSKGFRRVFRTA